jgi:SAM-dependent methyltransferase
VPDVKFAEPRLAAIYDTCEGDRGDLDLYLAIAEEHQATSFLDVGCGTGTLAVRLARLGHDVVAIDPAMASINVARIKPGAERVRWIHGTTATLPPLAVDMATMTGNVAQVFVHDDDWLATLTQIREALHLNGRLVFETRDPNRRAWEEWSADRTRSTIEVAGVGDVEHSTDFVDVSFPFVTFRETYQFTTDGTTFISESTLRFREREELISSLEEAGLTVEEIRDAPDRPGHEFVFLASVAG